MNPVRPCPGCGKDFNFHEDELEGVEDGRSICLDCGMELEMSWWVLDVVAGRIDVSHLLEDEEEDDGKNDE